MIKNIFLSLLFYLSIYLGLLTNSVYAMEQELELSCDKSKLSVQAVPRISQNQFREIASYASSYLKENENEIMCEKGESGFIRICLAPKNEELHCDKELYYVEKIRINYWPSNIELNDENIHSHTRNFESMIVSGDYCHKCYETHDCIDGEYAKYRINKGGDDNQRHPLFECRTNLILSQTESYNPGDIIVYPTETIHRISSVAPNTLSLNVVFKEDRNYYNAFLPIDDSEGFKIQMNFLSTKESKEFIAEILNLIETTLNLS